MKPSTVDEQVPSIQPALCFEEMASLFLRVAESEYPKNIEKAAQLIGDTFEAGGKLLIFGNGGSASDAQHLAGEMVVRFQTNRCALPALALSADSTVLTACANDFAYSQIFARQVEAFGAPGDVALGISTSGKSSNVICGLEAARRQHLQTILLTGASGAQSEGEWDLVLAVPSVITARIQEVHLATYHLICEFIDQRFTEQSL
jgi:D-sedoheptulose 7-phosphate isomerase